MDKFKLTKGSYFDFIVEINKEVTLGHTLYVSTSNEVNTGRWGMAKLWRAWMKNVADYMAAQGATMPLIMAPGGSVHGKRPFNAEDCHQLMTVKFIGQDENGNRLSWSRNGRDGMRPADKGERFHAMQKLDAWATEKGITLYRPQDSEYMQYEAMQNK